VSGWTEPRIWWRFGSDPDLDPKLWSRTVANTSCGGSDSSWCHGGSGSGSGSSSRNCDTRSGSSDVDYSSHRSSGIAVKRNTGCTLWIWTVADKLFNYVWDWFLHNRIWNLNKSHLGVLGDYTIQIFHLLSRIKLPGMELNLCSRDSVQFPIWIIQFWWILCEKYSSPWCICCRFALTFKFISLDCYGCTLSSVNDTGWIAAYTCDVLTRTHIQNTYLHEATSCLSAEQFLVELHLECMSIN